MLADITGMVAADSDTQHNLGARLITGSTDYALLTQMVALGPSGPAVLQLSAAGKLIIQPLSRVAYSAPRLTTIGTTTIVSLASVDATDYHRIAGSAATDVSGGFVYVQESDDNFIAGNNKFIETAYSFTSQTVHNPGGTTGTVYSCEFDHELTKQYVRILLYNGANAQAWYQYSAWLMNIVL